MALSQEELTSLCDDVDLERDRALVERCQGGDSAAFGNLYARYYDRLLRFCLRRLNDRHEAEDAAQEAFARAWKALPRFAGERRFYPWLTVIAGNICTDMLRRRSRSTPTDDMELTAQQPLGVVAEDTSEELVLAAVDGELVNRALGRLSARHRHVLAMREESGWTYQQIADHEGVEIGTIETLLWRARQALKREFAVVSDSKGALAGFLVATGALLKRGLFRVAGRGAGIHHQSSGSEEGLRNAVAGVAVAGAAVAAAFLAPHALSNKASPIPGAPGSALAAPRLVAGTRSGGGGPSGVPPTSAAGAPENGASGAADGSSTSATGAGGPVGTGSIGPGALGSILGGSSGGSAGLTPASGGLDSAVSGVTAGVGSTVGGVTSGITDTVKSLTQTLGLGSLLPGSSGSGSSGSGSDPSASGGSTTPTTTPTTLPGGATGGLGGAVGGAVNGVAGAVGAVGGTVGLLGG